jgi:hypothetical protein
MEGEFMLAQIDTQHHSSYGMRWLVQNICLGKNLSNQLLEGTTTMEIIMTKIQPDNGAYIQDLNHYNTQIRVMIFLLIWVLGSQDMVLI